MENEAFERWRVYHCTVFTTEQLRLTKFGWDGAIFEMSKPQSPDTCPKGHPRWAEVNGIEPLSLVCSICAEVAKVERERDALRQAVIKLGDKYCKCAEMFGYTCGIHDDVRRLLDEAALAHKEEHK